MFNSKLDRIVYIWHENNSFPYCIQSLVMLSGSIKMQNFYLNSSLKCWTSSFYLIRISHAYIGHLLLNHCLYWRSFIYCVCTENGTFITSNKSELHCLKHNVMLSSQMYRNQENCSSVFSLDYWSFVKPQKKREWNKRADTVRNNSVIVLEDICCNAVNGALLQEGSSPETSTTPFTLPLLHFRWSLLTVVLACPILRIN